MEPDLSLSREIELFHSERQRLNNLLTETIELFNKDFAKVLSSELLAAIQENLALTAVQDRVGQLFKGSRDNERPCVIIVGQTKSGKSSFINELLGGNFVAQRSTPCTARVTRLTYSERLFVRVLDSSGQQVGDTLHPEQLPIDEASLMLTGADRENEELLLGFTTEAGVPSEFLRRGLDVMDSPGLNENSTLDALTMGAIDSFLPVILYVIDGLYGVTLAAEKDIESIRASAMGVELFYLVTKMDVSQEDAPEPGSGKTVEDVERERAERVFRKLQEMQCLPAADTPSTCGRFFCLSSWEMRRHRRRVAAAARRAAKSAPDKSSSTTATTTTTTTPATSKWVERFRQMQQRLAEFAGQQFRSLVVGAGSSLLGLHSQIMDVVMSKANDIRASALTRRRNLEHIRALECRNHEQSKKLIDSRYANFSEQAKLFIERQSPHLLEEAKSMEYSNRVISDNLTSKQIEERCVAEIQDFVNNRIVAAYQEFLREGAMRSCFQDLEDLKARVFQYESGSGGEQQSPSLAVLKATLADDCSLDPKEIYSTSFHAVMRRMSLSIRTLFRYPGVILTRPVQDPEWKRFQAECHIKKIDTDKLVDCLVSSMHQWLDNRHFMFLQKIRYSEQLVENAASLSELERQKIVRLSPKLAFMYTRCLAIVTGYKFREYTIDPTTQLGSGAQGQVFAVRNPAGEVTMAAKRVTVDADSVGNISSEVFYSSVLRHPNLIRVEGVQLKQHRSADSEENAWTIELYMELMHCDLWNLMQRRQLPLGKRIWFGLQLAKALEFLHASDLIHRDVKLQNLLVDAKLETVKLTDFGLIKSAGLTGQSLVGTPIYLAPEMVTNSCYDVSADIYSLGIALWYLAEGSGRKHPEYAEINPNVGAILLASSMNSRPNRLPCVPLDLWDLMERCWDAIPSKRPPAKEVAEALGYICNNL